MNCIDQYIYVKIGNKGIHRTYYSRQTLHSNGYIFNKDEKKWVKQTLSADDVKTAKMFCKRHGFNFIVDYPQYRRSTNYRQEFLNTFKGFKIFNKQLYFCSYCGKILTRRTLTVDHLIPVKKAQTSQFARWLLHKEKIKNVNDTRNLIPACETCNKRKSSKMGIWLIRGAIGKHQKFWIIFWPVVFIAIGIIICKSKQIVAGSDFYKTEIMR